MVPPAPPRFSTMIGRFTCKAVCSNTTGGSTSVKLPAANGTIARIGLDGKFCAKAADEPSARQARTIEATIEAMLVMSPLSPRRRLRRFGAVQAMRGVLDGEEHHVGVGRRLRRMDHVRWHVDDRAGLGHKLLVTDLGA